MKSPLFLLLSLFSLLTMAQTQKNSDKSASAQFQKNYNEQNFTAIFDQFSPEMQAALPLEKTKDFFGSLNQSLGKINDLSFKSYQQSYALYKTIFERGTMSLKISVDNDLKINGMLVEQYAEQDLPTPERNKTILNLPFKGEWTVTWGGDTKDLNYHVESRAQKNAFDFVITDVSGKSYKKDGKTNEDYYAFGKEITAPCNGEIVLVVDGVKDNKPGILNPVYVPGNTVIIKTANNEYLFFAHFKNHTIRVKEGQKIKKGEVLGLCGNTGNSSEPHLHFHIQNTEEMPAATGIKCYFDEVIVNKKVLKDYSPIKNDKIQAVR